MNGPFYMKNRWNRSGIWKLGLWCTEDWKKKKKYKTKQTNKNKLTRKIGQHNKNPVTHLVRKGDTVVLPIVPINFFANLPKPISPHSWENMVTVRSQFSFPVLHSIINKSSFQLKSGFFALSCFVLFTFVSLFVYLFSCNQTTHFHERRG